MVSRKGEAAGTKRELATIARSAHGGVIGIGDSARALGVSRREASARLAAWTRAGWVARARRGVYMILPLEAESHVHTTAEDPWLLAAALFAPCYIGGWSAAEHWGLTEQIFRSTFVATAANIRYRRAQHLGASFTLARVKPERLQHLESIWRGSTRVLASSRERTIVDGAVETRWVGGFRHLADVFGAYTREPKADPAALLRELRRSGNGAAAKRVGYLAERFWESANDLIEGAHALRSAGVVKLDPAIARRGRKSSRWGLWLNVSLNGRDA
jgi:predicted transcriptional regulator of viral defense system